jgi:hypothetical protein
VDAFVEVIRKDGWTTAADRGSRAFGRSLILGGFGAPLFLLRLAMLVIEHAQFGAP